MATELKIRRGSTNEINLFTPALAELVVDTDKYVLRLGDGVTRGGLPLTEGNETAAIRKDTFANLILLSPTTNARTFVCQERANAEYILQASGYVALAGDATFANGRVAALQIVVWRGW